MSDNRDTSVIFTGRATSTPTPAIAPHAVPLPPVVGPNVAPAPSMDAGGFAPIITRGEAQSAANGLPLQPTGIAPESITIVGLHDNNKPSTGVVSPAGFGATPIPSILRQPQASQSQIDPSLPRLRALPVKEFLVGKSHFFVISMSAIASLMYIISWGVAIAEEKDGKLRRRHVASILGFVFQLVTTLCVVLALRREPTLYVLYGLQVLALIALFLTCVGMGMNNVIVDLCSSNTNGPEAFCPAHYAEFFAAFFVAIGMMLVFFATQQRIAVLIDKGILSNIRGRMTQL